jgi:hypothetical protein
LIKSTPNNLSPQFYLGKSLPEEQGGSGLLEIGLEAVGKALQVSPIT